MDPLSAGPGVGRGISVRAVRPGEARVDAVIARHLDLMRAVTPPEGVFAQDSEGLARDGARMFAAFEGEDLLGIGAFKPIGPGHVELKSMHVLAEARGRGAGRALLAHILAAARAEGALRASLETGSGPAFAPAARLYERAGFVCCDPFGDYPPNPFSLFMTKAL